MTQARLPLAGQGETDEEREAAELAERELRTRQAFAALDIENGGLDAFARATCPIPPGEDW